MNPNHITSRLRRYRRQLGMAGMICVVAQSAAADETWLYAVQINATVQTNPAQITLHWEPDELGANSYTIYRKLKDETSWGAPTVLSGAISNYTDSEVSYGAAYEYQIIKRATLGYTGYGYIYAGIDAPLIDHRGTVVLIVAADTVALADGLTQLQNDLVGDGWFVIRHDVSPQDNPGSVRELVRADYNANPSEVQTVFLLGHVPIVMSGDLNYDSHGARPLPADGFYGDMTGNWNLELDPTNRPSYFPAPIELMVGRVDFFDMPGIGALQPWPSETQLLQRYLDKDHAWRHKMVTVPRRALMANRVGDFQGQAYAATGYRNFTTFVGAGNIVEADISDTAPPEQRWISFTTNSAWLWSYGCSGGQDNVISELGTHAPYNDVWSTDVVGQDSKVVFSMFFGSHFGDWTRTDNIMRSVLATPSLGLTACLAGLPHWFCHHMAMGEPIGYAARLTMNNTVLYQNQSNALPRAVFINLLGDPTLRMESVAPPSGLSASATGAVATLNWSSSPDPLVGYHVYRSASAAGPFARLTDSPISATSYTDSAPFSVSSRTYMVRAIALQNNPSGSHFNPSEGVFVQVDVDNSSPPVPAIISAALQPEGIQLSWASRTNSVYHVEAKSLVPEEAWTNLSGQLTAGSSVTSFVDTNSALYQARLYRVVSE
ncbi:MAG TPA: hypothetical protein VL361_24830 [Candidatus Limnocylindrales bacterium]|nr:hypothetical protein [Candidatus Limnocylindrales bacterium]